MDFLDELRRKIKTEWLPKAKESSDAIDTLFEKYNQKAMENIKGLFCIAELPEMKELIEEIGDIHVCPGPLAVKIDALTRQELRRSRPTIQRDFYESCLRDHDWLHIRICKDGIRIGRSLYISAADLYESPYRLHFVSYGGRELAEDIADNMAAEERLAEAL